MFAPIFCAAGCDHGRVPTGRLIELRAEGRFVDEMEECPRCHGTGNEPCEICTRPTWSHPAVARVEDGRTPGGVPVCEECLAECEADERKAS